MKTLLFLIVVVFAVGTTHAQLNMKKEDGGILIVEGNNSVLKYQTEKKSADKNYERCNYVHPLWGIDGEIMTEDFPVDHPHHRGIFWSWHQVWIGDKRIGDPWLLKDFEQEVVELEFTKLSDEKVAIFSEVNWKSNAWRKAGKKYPFIQEKAQIVIHAQKQNYRQVDFRIELTALEDKLRIGGSEDEKGYGGFSARIKLPHDVQFLGKEGVLKAKTTPVASKDFVNLWGSLGKSGGKSGIVIADSDENPGYPQKWILREKNSMQNAVWPGNKAAELKQNESIVLQYSMLIYSGKMSNKKITRILN